MAAMDQVMEEEEEEEEEDGDMTIGCQILVVDFVQWIGPVRN